AKLFNQLGIVLDDDPVTDRLLVRFEKPVIAEHLRGLHLHQVGSLDRPMDEAGAVDVLVGVVNRNGGGRRTVLAGGPAPGVDQLIADQRAGAVVHDHEVGGIVAQALQAKPNRVLPAFATKPDVDRLPPTVAFELPRHLEEVPLGDQQGDARDLETTVESLERSADEGTAPHGPQDLRTGLSLVKPGPGSRDDGLYLHSSPLFVFADL